MQEVSRQDTFDILVLGSGAAGLSVVLRALERDPNLKIAVLAKNDPADGSTAYAQGGIAAVLDENEMEAADSVESHVADTLDAGAGLCKLAAVQFVAERAKEAIDWLVAQGVEFDRAENSNGEAEGAHFHLGREGGHTTGALFTRRTPPAARLKPRCSGVCASAACICSIIISRWT